MPRAAPTRVFQRVLVENAFSRRRASVPDAVMSSPAPSRVNKLPDATRFCILQILSGTGASDTHHRSGHSLLPLSPSYPLTNDRDIIAAHSLRFTLSQSRWSLSEDKIHNQVVPRFVRGIASQFL